MKASNGVNANGEMIVTKVNGVDASVVFTGSPVHLHHLAQLAIVSSSFGRKTGGIDDVSAGSRLCPRPLWMPRFEARCLWVFSP